MLGHGKPESNYSAARNRHVDGKIDEITQDITLPELLRGFIRHLQSYAVADAAGIADNPEAFGIGPDGDNIAGADKLPQLLRQTAGALCLALPAADKIDKIHDILNAELGG